MARICSVRESVGRDEVAAGACRGATGRVYDEDVFANNCSVLDKMPVEELKGILLPVDGNEEEDDPDTGKFVTGVVSILEPLE
jgi:hypothetical protein